MDQVKHNSIKVMNVAGTRASKDPMIYQAATELLEATLSKPEFLNELSPTIGDWLMRTSGVVDFQRRKVGK